MERDKINFAEGAETRVRSRADYARSEARRSRRGVSLRGSSRWASEKITTSRAKQTGEEITSASRGVFSEQDDIFRQVRRPAFWQLEGAARSVLELRCYRTSPGKVPVPPQRVQMQRIQRSWSYGDRLPSTWQSEASCRRIKVVRTRSSCLRNRDGHDR